MKRTAANTFTFGLAVAMLTETAQAALKVSMWGMGSHRVCWNSSTECPSVRLENYVSTTKRMGKERPFFVEGKTK